VTLLTIVPQRQQISGKAKIVDNVPSASKGGVRLARAAVPACCALPAPRRRRGPSLRACLD